MTTPPNTISLYKRIPIYVYPYIYIKGVHYCNNLISQYITVVLSMRRSTRLPPQPLLISIAYYCVSRSGSAWLDTARPGWIWLDQVRSKSILSIWPIYLNLVRSGSIWLCWVIWFDLYRFQSIWLDLV